MGRIIKKHLIHSCQGSSGKLDIYLFVEADYFRYTSMTRDYYVALICESSAENKCTLKGSIGSLTVFGKYTQLSSSYTLENGENVLEGIIMGGIKHSDFGDKIPFELNLGLTCAELGLTQPITVNTSIANYPFYTAPVIGVPSVNRLGSEVALSGDFLDVGYDVTAKVIIGGEAVSEQAVDLQKKTLNTSLEWITPYPNDSSISASIVFSASFYGEPLPSELTVPITLALSGEDAAPSVNAYHEVVSDIEAIAVMKNVAVKGRSSVIIKASDVNGRYGATVEQIAITFDGQTYQGDIYESDVLDVAGTFNYSIKVTDSRGFYSSAYGSVTVHDYLPPSFTATAKQTDQNGAENKSGACATILAELISYSGFDGANSCSFYYTLRSLGGVEGAEIPFEGDTQLVIDAGLDGSVTYELKIICRDLFDGFSSKVFLLEKENIEINIAKNKVGIGKYGEKERILDCAWPISCVGDVTIVDENGVGKSVIEMGSSVTVHDVSDEQAFTRLTTPPENSVRVILMNIINNVLGYSNGYHAFLAFNNKGSIGRFELKTV